MKKNVAIGVLAAVVIWLTVRVIELENFRYATFLGMCESAGPSDTPDQARRYECLKETQTRTNPLWHLFFALIEGV